MASQEFRSACLAFWKQAITETIGINPPESSIWRDSDSIRKAVEPFMAMNRNHAHLPAGGGMDFHSVRHSTEDGCLEFSVGQKSAYIMKPRSLNLEVFPASLINSFLLLELAPLEPSGIEPRSRNEYEQLFELYPGDYRSREVWDRGFLDHDEDGMEVPLPDHGRLVVRFLGGKVLIVSKGSLWNGVPATYDGRHNRMTSSEIRALIERSLVRAGD